MNLLLELIHTPGTQDWKTRCEAAFDQLFETRYPKRAHESVAYRTPEMKSDSGVPYAALIHAANPDSGMYGGMSFVIFPRADGPALVAMAIGTQGLSPDEQILGRPGHARKCQAIARWLNVHSLCAWGKNDPTRIDIDLPDMAKTLFGEYPDAISRYGKVLYAGFVPGDSKTQTESALKAFLDLMFAERGFMPRKAHETEAKALQQDYLSMLMPKLNNETIHELLMDRRFVILQGPPGTGKSMRTLQILKEQFGGHGISVQFHPSTSYEQVIGGLFPEPAESGLHFSPQAGCLMQAALVAAKTPDRPYLLHIDEINRADLAKVLGEAIFLLEPGESRSLTLPYDFPGMGRQLTLPQNLYILGTMNSSDRSIAIMDIAIRRRFAFLSLWPEMEVIQERGAEIMVEAYQRLLQLFLEHARAENFTIIPGHAYFLERDDAKARRRLKTTLLPLLLEYLEQGYVSGFADGVESYCQWIETL